MCHRLYMTLKTLRRYYKLAAAYLPSRLPQGLTEFHAWADDIISLYGFPDNDSWRFALAATIVHLREGRAYVPKRYFGLILMKGASTQIAGQVMQDLKAKQNAAATAPTLTAVANEQPS